MVKTVIPADPDDLVCDTCPNRFADRGNFLRTVESAWVARWHIYIGRNDQAPKVLCPSCIGTPRSRIPAPPVLEGQTSIDGELEITFTMTPIVKKNRKGREMQ